MFQGDKKSGDSPRPSGINGIEKSNLKKKIKIIFDRKPSKSGCKILKKILFKIFYV